MTKIFGSCFRSMRMETVPLLCQSCLCCRYCHCRRFIDGYTIRTYTLKGLILQDVAPPLDEISRFNAAGQVEADDMNVSGKCGGYPGLGCRRHASTASACSVVSL